MTSFSVYLKGIPYQISYTLRKGSNKTLLYLHGGACSKEDFQEALTQKALEDYTICAFDFPGCGGSSYENETPLGIDELVEITADVVDHLALQNITLLGHSLGGLVGLLYAQNTPNVQGFINIEGNVAPENCLFSRKTTSVSYDTFQETQLPALLRDLSKSTNKGLRVWKESLTTANPKAFYDCCPSIVQYSDHGNLLDMYMALEIPKLYLYSDGCASGLTYLDTLTRNNCPTVMIPHSNHFMFHDNPTAFYQEIESFLETP